MAVERIFESREDAALEISNKLRELKGQHPLIIGIPRGAVPMAKVIARELDGDLDIVLVHKVGHPEHSEFAVASVTEEGDIIMGEGGKRVGLKIDDVREAAREEIERLKQKRMLFTPDRDPIDPSGRVVVVVDDGIATGATMAAAVKSLQKKNPSRLIVAAPVASEDGANMFKNMGVETCILSVPKYFYAVSEFFSQFHQISDEEAIQALMTPPTEISIEVDSKTHVKALLSTPQEPRGLIIFAHGSGSGRLSPRNQSVARELNQKGFATLLADLLSEEEAQDRTNVFDIERLGDRVGSLIEWSRDQDELMQLPIGLFGASTGAAAALYAAARHREQVGAIVSRGGRPDLAVASLMLVDAPTLFIVGSEDTQVLELNRWAFDRLRCEKKLETVPGATHLFEEPGAIEKVSELATNWFNQELAYAIQKPAAVAQPQVGVEPSFGPES